MDKTTSVIGAFEAGKLPSTQQIARFAQWVNEVGIGQLPSRSLSAVDVDVNMLSDNELSEQGQLLAKDFQGDNIVQQSLYHFSQSSIQTSSEVQDAKSAAQSDLTAIRNSFQHLLQALYTSFTSEGNALLSDLMKLLRLGLADAAGLIEEQAGRTKSTLRNVQEGVDKGDRDTLGLDKKAKEEKKRLVEEEPAEAVKQTWEAGMEGVKDAGVSAITAMQTAEHKGEEVTGRFGEAWNKSKFIRQITDRAQSDPQYRQALDQIFSILQKRLDTILEAAQDPNLSLSDFIQEKTPEQHLTKSIKLMRKFVERLAGGKSIEPLINQAKDCSARVANDPDLKKWFDEFFSFARKNLTEQGYARSEDSKAKRKELKGRWRSMIEKEENGPWRDSLERLKTEVSKFQDALESDADLNRVKEAHVQFGNDVEKGLVEVKEGVQDGLQSAVEQATWFWRDLFRVYVPRWMNKLKDVPIPRTEYKDSEIEFVLENLDISSFNINPSHVFIRNITDIDIQSGSPSLSSSTTHTKTSVGGLTHIRIQAMQLALKDVSFWYKDKTASALSPNEFTGLLSLRLPEKGVDVDLKVRLIPARAKSSVHVSGPGRKAHTDETREAKGHFNVIEKCSVSISDDVGVDVRESNHSVLVTLFKPLVAERLKQALERTLSEQVRGVVEWVDGVAWDVSKRQEVFEDMGMGAGSSLMGALWSEIGRLKRLGMEEIREGESVFGWRATGSGVIVEQMTAPDVEGEGEVKKSQFAMGVEPQILSGSKRGPIGTGSESLRDKADRLAETQGVDLGVAREGAQVGLKEVRDVVKDAKSQVEGAVGQGKKRLSEFRGSVEKKRKQEEVKAGWESKAFDF
ncbi:hypothetical protein CVT24_003048 [Panaeolus cyanescens]|uniref:Uncharacterized protein n=1 Tax=Panaeolus cyanescens TaxID=181874 RepID=A0A409W8S2_9AGAR|nr:hypothetical protein CVT24_003048 [Panaeolus cyanescens]